MDLVLRRAWRNVLKLSWALCLIAGVACGPLAAQDTPLKVRELYAVKQAKSPLFAATMSRDGKMIASHTFPGGLRIWDIDKAEEARLIPHQSMVRSLAFSHDGKRIAVGGDGGVRIYSVTNGKQLASVPLGPADRVECVVFSPSGNSVLIGVSTGDRAIRLCSAASGKETRRYPGHSMGVTSLAFLADGKRFVSGGEDKSVRLWDVAKTKELRRFDGHTGIVLSVAVSPDGKRVLSGGGDKSVRLWDADSGDEVRKLDETAGAVSGLAFFPGGRLAVSGAGGKIDVVEVPGGGVRRTVSLGKEQAVRLWDLQTGKELHRFEGPAFAVGTVAVSVHGSRVLAVGANGSVHVWEFADPKTLPQP